LSLFRRLRRRRSPRVVVIGIDGTPHSLIDRLMDEGRMPHFASLVRKGHIRPINSVYPTVSSVAWSSFMTGVNPARHRIYGFLDRNLGSYETFIPTASHMRAPTLWEKLSEIDRRVIIMNVPVTFPPKAVNGILVSGFLSPSLDRATYPASVGRELAAMGYRLDIDPWKARESKQRLLEDFQLTLAKRVEAMFHFMDSEPWDFFQCHIMETDRLHHFLWEDMVTGHPQYSPAFYDCYTQIDEVLGQVAQRLDDHTTLIVLSDHGFCTLKWEVQVNHWLAERGWLGFEKTPPQSLADIAPESRAFSLIPGRLYLNLRGREPRGSVAPADYEVVREELATMAMEMRDPDTGAPMIGKVLRREEIYEGPHLDEAADLILVPHRGYDLKARLHSEAFVSKGALSGMHTYDDAFFYYVGDSPLSHDVAGVQDVLPVIMEQLA
jgi:predicted AlkP superfamily phosphohydrolase/phosphomutase